MQIPWSWRARLLRGPVGRFVREAAAMSPMTFGPRERLVVGRHVNLVNTLFNTVSGSITIGDHSFFGHGVSVLTGTHEIESFGPERQRHPTGGRDITIGTGVWIASNATVLGPCVIGDHAVIAAGALVTHDVPPATIVAGIPATVVRTLALPGG
jgi:acetyltransferase-like isoleucine patch superfamily enzyme